MAPLLPPPLAALPAMAMPPRAPELLERLRRALDAAGGSPTPDDAGAEEEVGVALRGGGGGREGIPVDFARLAWRAYRS